MKKILFIILIGAFTLSAKAQDKPHIYNPEADAKAEIKAAVNRLMQDIKMCFYKLAATGVSGASALMTW